MDTKELADDPSFEQRRIRQTMQHPTVGPYTMTAWPVRFSGSPPEVKPSPLLGEHSEEVLAGWLGLDRAAIAKQRGVDYMFGIVGFPVQPIAAAAQEAGITYIGMRNEQSASYAAQAAGYLTGRPGACLTVSGPGVVHGLAGLANAQQNCWPMVLIGGASPTHQNGMGAFQEERQVQIASPFCKFAHAVEHVHRIPFYVEMAVRNSIYGR